MKASIAIQVLPQVGDKEELIRIVDEVIAYIQSTGLRYEVGPFETAIEGDDMDQLMDIAKVDDEPEGEVLTIDRKISKYHQK